MSSLILPELFWFESVANILRIFVFNFNFNCVLNLLVKKRKLRPFFYSVRFFTVLG